MDINSKNLMIIIISILMLYLREIVCSAKGEDEDIEIKNSTTIRTVKTTIRDIIPTTIIKSSQIITQTNKQQLIKHHKQQLIKHHKQQLIKHHKQQLIKHHRLQFKKISKPRLINCIKLQLLERQQFL